MRYLPLILVVLGIVLAVTLCSGEGSDRCRDPGAADYDAAGCEWEEEHY